MDVTSKDRQLQIVPVIDVKHGQAVHAVRGQRSHYQPVHSALVDSCDPIKIGLAMIAHLAPRAIYVADLDAICGQAIQQSIINQFTQLDCELWIDFGARTTNFEEFAFHVQRHTHMHAILATESLNDPQLVKQALARFGVDRVIVSLDLHAGELKTATAVWSLLSPLQLASSLYAQNIRRFIVLDTNNVGSKRGCSTLGLSSQIKRTLPDIFLATGGGVRDQSDLDRFAISGCDAALVATAIHNGSLTQSTAGRCDT